MSLQIELWQLISLIMAGCGALATLGKVLLMQIDKRLEQRFGIVERDIENWRRLEREFQELRVDLPLQYVRREDYVRNQTVIEAKLDALALKLENIMLRGSRHD